MIISFRRCDSRNINLSPFCTLDVNSMLPKWKTAVNDTYGSSSDGLDYINGVPSPTRKEYKKPIMRKREILSSLSEVILDLFFNPLRRILSTMPMNGISLSWTSFLDKPQHLVIFFCWNFLFLLSSLKSSRDRKRWPGLILPPIWEASLASPSASALSRLLNFSIGFPSNFAEIWPHTRNRN